MLTDTKCRNAKPTEKPYKLTDAKGLYLEVKPNGVKAWRYRFELWEGEKAKESVFAIGEYASPRLWKPPMKRKPGGAAGASPLPKRGKNAPRPAHWSSRASIRPITGS